MRRAKRHHVLIAVAAAAVLSGATVAIGASRSSSALPDLRITPGAVLTTSAPTVCVSGYSATVRASLSPAEQRQVNTAYHWTYAQGKQEYDHLIPLELGGDNGVKNIWPQPIAQARVKDGLENRLHALVCQHNLALTTAQSCIAANWVRCAKQY